MRQNINLLEHARRRRRVHESHRIGIGATLCLLVAGAAVLWQWNSLQDARARLAKAEASTEQLRADMKEGQMARADSVRQAVVTEQEVRTLEAFATQLVAGNQARTWGFAEDMRAFARCSVQGVWLTRLHIDHRLELLEIEGRTDDASRLPALLKSLHDEPYLSGTAFASLELQPVEGQGRDAAGGLQFRLATARHEEVVPAAATPPSAPPPPAAGPGTP